LFTHYAAAVGFRNNYINKIIIVNNTAKPYKGLNPIRNSMLKSSNLIEKIISLLRKDPKQQFQQLAKKLRVNRTFLAGHFSALKSERKLDRER
jgi:hypothetical protein